MSAANEERHDSAMGGGYSRLHPGYGHGSADYGGEVAKTTAMTRLRAVYHGKGAHAAVDPASGVNALDAYAANLCKLAVVAEVELYSANIAYMSINALRQHIDATARVHGIIISEPTWVANSQLFR